MFSSVEKQEASESPGQRTEIITQHKFVGHSLGLL